MIEEHAIVVEAVALDGEAETALIEVVREKACGLCGKTSGCGNAFWGKLFSHKPQHFRAANTIGASVGQRVVVGIDEQAVMKTALMLYMLPLVSMFFVAILAAWLSSSNGVVMIAAVLGLGIGFAWVKAHTAGRQYYHHHQPKILRLSQERHQESFIQFQ